jgi:hypothetical protein
MLGRFLSSSGKGVIQIEKRIEDKNVTRSAFGRLLSGLHFFHFDPLLYKRDKYDYTDSNHRS